MVGPTLRRSGNPLRATLLYPRAHVRLHALRWNLFALEVSALKFAPWECRNLSSNVKDAVSERNAFSLPSSARSNTVRYPGHASLAVYRAERHSRGCCYRSLYESEGQCVYQFRGRVPEPDIHRLDSNWLAVGEF